MRTRTRGGEGYLGPFIAGIPGEIRVCYFPTANIASTLPTVLSPLSVSLTDLDPSGSYRAFFFDPKCEDSIEIDIVEPDPDGTWEVPTPGVMQDWVLVVEQE